MKTTLIGMGLMLLLAGACGGEATTFGSGGGVAAGGNGQGGSPAGPGSGGNGAGGSGAGGMSTSVGGSGAGGASGAICGGFAGATCLESEYCDFPDNQCGATDGQGVCTPRPVNCTDEFDPVCACDGMVYGNGCDAASQGNDVSHLGNCPLEPGQFACGPKACTTAGQYCLIHFSDVGGEPDVYSCEPHPVTCMTAVPTCTCLTAAAAACGGQCTGGGDAGLTVSCPGG